MYRNSQFCYKKTIEATLSEVEATFRGDPLREARKQKTDYLNFDIFA